MTNSREVRRIARDTELDSVQEELGDLPGPADTEAEMQNILAEFDRTSEDDKWEIKVYRVLGAAKLGNREPFLFYASPSDFPILEKLRDEWANEQFGRINTFRIRVYKNRMLVKNFTFDIEAKDKPPAPPVTQEIRSEMSVFATTLERMQAQNNAMFERLLQRIEHPPQQQQPAADPIALFEKFSTIFANMRPQGEQGFSALDVFDKALTLAEKIGGSDRETNLFDIVKEALAQLPALAALSGQQPGAAPRPQPARIAPPGAPQPQRPAQSPAPQPQRQQPPGASPINVVGLNEQQLQLARNLLTQLNEAAKAGGPVEQYAAWLDDNIPPAFLDQILAIENLQQWCVSIVPDVAPQWEWFAALFDALSEDDLQDGEDDLSGPDAIGPSTPPTSFNGNTGGTGGRKNDARDNVSTGTSGKEKSRRKNKGG